MFPLVSSFCSLLPLFCFYLIPNLSLDSSLCVPFIHLLLPFLSISIVIFISRVCSCSFNFPFCLVTSLFLKSPAEERQLSWFPLLPSYLIPPHFLSSDVSSPPSPSSCLSVSPLVSSSHLLPAIWNDGLNGHLGRMPPSGCSHRCMKESHLYLITHCQ